MVVGADGTELARAVNAREALGDPTARRLNHRPEVRGGVLARECAAPLEAFFARQRLG
ncbi:cytidine/deoxycytidylate deaminase [Mycobacterium tuberculosis]|uniref:Cytidine/deoxycytidylate deaminase n=1 Tax=Mycobacterium tuberculosis TaxID=1773 RepID=A0A654TWM8_MYCTX|nr:cytidine/deoxycytidylate deaminase [Mycobacterium tuberculosis]